jgi:hypothetical protein
MEWAEVPVCTRARELQTYSVKKNTKKGIGAIDKHVVPLGKRCFRVL